MGGIFLQRQTTESLDQPEPCTYELEAKEQTRIETRSTHQGDSEILSGGPLPRGN